MEPSYAAWTEEQRVDWLVEELHSRRPFFHIHELESLGFDAEVMDTMLTFKVAASLGPGSLGAYVISRAGAASDVLSVMLLQQQFGFEHRAVGQRRGSPMLRVVPLFESLTDLTNAPAVVEQLFRLRGYLPMVGWEQEIMVGYSDSAKDAGRLAACWAQYESQEQMARIADRYGVRITFFHGKGGTVGRGGNPARKK